jgi:NitT/TauT family transport system permease protein
MNPVIFKEELPVKKLTRRLLFYLGFIFLWQLLCQAKIWPEYMVPSPRGVLASFLDGLADHSFFIGTLVSLKRIAIGYGISIILGMGLGFAIGRSQILEDTVGSLVVGLQTLPSICWLPLAILWFGLSERAMLFVVVMGALLSITISTDSGVKNIPAIFVKAGQNMGAKGLTMLSTILLPAALPAIVTGLKQGWSFAWRSLMAGELLYVSMGLGQLLMMGRELNDMNRVIAVMLILIVLGLLFDRLLFARLERSIRRRWGLETA